MGLEQFMAGSWDSISMYHIFDLISEHPLISGHPHFLLVEIIVLLHPIII